MTRPCHRTSNESDVVTLGYTTDERGVLTLARFYFQSFTNPQDQSWLNAVGHALQQFGHQDGPNIAVAVLAVVQTMRRSRMSVFQFNCAECRTCSVYVTAAERTFMSIIRAAAANNAEAAEGHAMILCEGNDTVPLVRAAFTLVQLLYPEGAARSQRYAPRTDIQEAAKVAH